MAFASLIQSLKETEQQLEKQLESVRGAISSLEIDTTTTPSMPDHERGKPSSSNNRKGIIVVGGRSSLKTIPSMPPPSIGAIRHSRATVTAPIRKRRELSTKGRAAIVKAQKARWAKNRLERKKPTPKAS